jgi:hypothetical protein
MNRVVFFVFFIFTFFSCKQEIPKNILLPEKMQSIQWEMMQADEMVDYYRLKDSSYATEKKRVEYYLQILQSYKISKEEFHNSVRFYENHPELLKKILDSMQTKGQGMQQNIKDTAPTKPLLHDTLNRFQKQKTQY